MTKVCHVTSAHNSYDVRIFRKECASLAKAGYDVFLVAQGESREESGVHVIGVGEAPRGRLERMTTFAKKVYKKALSLDADIYHLHDPELLGYALKLKKRGKKVVFDSHEDTSMQITGKEYLPVFVRKMVSSAYRFYETHVVKNIDAVIVPCTFQGKDIFEGRARETVIIANYPLLDEFDYTEVNQSARGDYICYVGALTYQRGISYVIRAAAKSETPLVLAGLFTPQSFEDEVKAMAEFSSVDYRGMVSRTEVADIIKRSVAGLCTLLRVEQYDIIDTFGIKVYEYMSLGVPVIITDYPYVRQIMEKCRFGICVDPEDIDEIAKAITYLREHPDEAREMGENGRAAVEKEFNWSTQESILLDLYERI